MKYRIEDKPAFRIFGVEGIFPIGGENDSFPRSPHELWRKDLCEKLLRDAGVTPAQAPRWAYCGINGACGYRDTGRDTFPYMLFAFAGPDSKTEGYTVVEIPAQTYAIFPSEPFKWDNKIGETINALYQRFYREWLPGSGYELLEGAGDFEIYDGDTKLGQVELWYPIAKKIE
jgi:AraC family transcriptional regulator